jgi:lipoyl(octanoyl) transferase
MVNREPGTLPEWRISAGLIPYAQAVAEMENRVAAVAAGRAAELIWLLEHPPLYTAGTSAKPEELLIPDLLPVFPAGRGGRYTYHGPGQRLAYAILDLRRRNLGPRAYSQALESWAIATLARFGIAGERRPGRVGIWVSRQGSAGEDKIAAIGVRVRHGVAYHGLSINLDPDLRNYRGIVPCGIPMNSTVGVTSLAGLGVKTMMCDVDAALMACFEDVFNTAG